MINNKHNQEKLKELTKKYFWEQKTDELSILVYIFLVIVFIGFVLYMLGFIFQGFEFNCKFAFSANLSSSNFDNCMNNTLSFWMTLAFGIFNLLFLLFFIILPILVIYLIFQLFYSWIDSNLDKATERALEELSKKNNKNGGKNK